MANELQNLSFFKQVIDLFHSARKQVVQQVNLTMVQTYFEIGRMVVEEEHNGKDCTEYGKHLLAGLSKILIQEFGKGFSTTNIQQMRSFYLTYQKQQTVSANFTLSWLHYSKLGA